MCFDSFLRSFTTLSYVFLHMYFNGLGAWGWRGEDVGVRGVAWCEEAILTDGA